MKIIAFLMVGSAAAQGWKVGNGDTGSRRLELASRERLVSRELDGCSTICPEPQLLCQPEGEEVDSSKWMENMCYCPGEAGTTGEAEYCTTFYHGKCRTEDRKCICDDGICGAVGGVCDTDANDCICDDETCAGIGGECDTDKNECVLCEDKVCDWQECKEQEDGLICPTKFAYTGDAEVDTGCCEPLECDCYTEAFFDENTGPGPGQYDDTLWSVGLVVYTTYEECMCNGCDNTGFCGPPTIEGDPHIKTFGGEWYDYQGQCDLKMIHAPKFDEEQDMDIDIRTTIRYDYSFVEAAALKIGDDVLEVGSFGDYALNGVEGALGTNGNSVPTVGGYPVYYTQVNKKKHVFDVVLADNKNITLKTYKDWVSVNLFQGNKETFGAVSGLMGNYAGQLLGRDGSDLSGDMNAMGESWQIQAGDAHLFRTTRAPQAPAACELPNVNVHSAGAGLTKSQAEEACAGFSGHAMEFCVHDVMVSGDLTVAAEVY